MPIHPTAIISPKAQIDPTAEIGPYVVVEGEVTVGPNCRIFPHVYICGYAHIGANNEIHAGATVGDLPQDRAFRPCRSYVEIGDNNVIRECVTIHRGTTGESATLIGDDCFLMAYSHVAHNCRLGSGVTLANMTSLCGYVQVADGAFLSGYVGVHQFVRIGRLCMIGGAAKIKMDIPPFLMAVNDSQVIDVNRVGLRRAGLGSDDISQVRWAYKMLYRSGKPFGKAVEQVSAEYSHPLVKELVDFVTMPSRRGISGPPDRRKRGGDNVPVREDG